VCGDQNQVLRISLPRAVGIGGTTRLTIEYTVNVPNCYGRFGYGDDTMSLVNCNPILSVYDGGKWYDYPYYAVGDPFYSETADYEATITAPEDWTIAATGVLTEREQGADKVWTVDAPGRRDFGFVASDNFDVMQTTVDGVLVRSYYLRGSKSGGREALDTGAQAIDLYSKTFGQYPFSEFSIAEADFFIGGMEYPGMVLIDHSWYGSTGSLDKMTLDLLVSHETGHQWWYSVIGDNEVMEPWLDEGLTEFTTQYFFEKERSASYNDYYQQNNDYYKTMRSDQEGEYAATLPVYDFEDNQTYSAWVYDRTAEVLQDLRKKIGDGKFFSALQEYYRDNRLGTTTGADLEKAFEDASGMQLSQWFEQEFNSSGD
jgi:aminopeptidase N